MCQCDIVLVVKKCVPSIVISSQMKLIKHFLGATVSAIRRNAIMIRVIVQIHYWDGVCKNKLELSERL